MRITYRYYYIQLISFLLLYSSCAFKPLKDYNEQKRKQLTEKDLAEKLYIAADIKSFEGTFTHSSKTVQLVYHEEIVINMFKDYYSPTRFRKYMIDTLAKNYTREQLFELIEQFESVEFKKRLAKASTRDFNHETYAKYIAGLKQDEATVERGEVLARVLVNTRLPDITHRIISEMTMAVRRANYFIKYDYVPNSKMLLALKQQEVEDIEKFKYAYNAIFKELTHTLLFSFRNTSTNDLYEIHNFYSRGLLKDLSLRTEKLVNWYFRELRLDFTKDLLVYMREKHSDRVPAAVLKYE